MSQSSHHNPQSYRLLDGPLLVIGAAYTGKSELAQQSLEPQKKTVVIGTADLREGLMLRRVEELRRQRPVHWDHVMLGESLGEQIKALTSSYEQILLDSINQWIANRMLESINKYSPEQLALHIDLEVRAFYEHLEQLPPSCRLVIVSSEVGAGITPPKPIARIFRQMVSRINCRLAAISPSVLLVSAGIPLLIKGTWRDTAPAAPQKEKNTSAPHNALTSRS